MDAVEGEEIQPTPPIQSRIAQAIATAPTPKENPLSGMTYTPRPLLTASKLTPAQIENAKLVSISYMINAQMHEQEGTVENAMFDGTETLLMNNLDDYEMVNNVSTKDYVVVKRGQETKIVFRGKQGDSDMNHAERVITG